MDCIAAVVSVVVKFLSLCIPIAKNSNMVSSTATAKFALALVFCGLAALTLVQKSHAAENNVAEARQASHRQSRRLEETGTTITEYMDDLFADLEARKKLFKDTPEEEIKYWFEYSGALQVRCTRFDDVFRRPNFLFRNTFTASRNLEEKPIILKAETILALYQPVLWILLGEAQLTKRS